MLVSNPLEQFQVDSLFNFFYFDGTSFFDIAYSNYAFTVFLLFTFLVVSANIYVLILFIIFDIFNFIFRRNPTSFVLEFLVFFFRLLVKNQNLQLCLLFLGVFCIFILSVQTFSLLISSCTLIIQIMLFLTFTVGKKISNFLVLTYNEKFFIISFFYLIFMLYVKSYFFIWHFFIVLFFTTLKKTLFESSVYPEFVLTAIKDKKINDDHLRDEFTPFNDLAGYTALTLSFSVVMSLAFPQTIFLHGLDLILFCLMFNALMYILITLVIRVIIIWACNPVVGGHRLFYSCAVCMVGGGVMVGSATFSNSIVCTPLDLFGANKHIQLYAHGYYWKTAGEALGIQSWTFAFPYEAVPTTSDLRVDLVEIHRRLEIKIYALAEARFEPQNPFKWAYYKKLLAGSLIVEPPKLDDSTLAVMKRFNDLNTGGKKHILKTMSELEDIDKFK